MLGGLSSSWLIGRIGAGSVALLNLVIQALAYAGIALSISPLIMALMLGLQSYTGSIGGVVGESFRQAIIPDGLMGRMGSAFRFYALGAMAVGALIGGLLACSFGLLTPYWLSALVMLVLSAALLPVVTNRAIAQARQVAQPDAASEEIPGQAHP